MPCRNSQFTSRAKALTTHLTSTPPGWLIATLHTLGLSRASHGHPTVGLYLYAARSFHLVAVSLISIKTGGQDDLVTIFSPWEQRVVARCQGHSSFVSAVAFDELHCDGRTYRFGSVGEDNKLILVSRTEALLRPRRRTDASRRSGISSLVPYTDPKRR